MRRARPWSRARWCSMTRSARATLARYSAGRSTAFSKRERVGCEARGGPASGSRSSEELVDWVLSQPGRVVAVGVAAGDPVDALPHQLDQLVLHLAGLPSVGQAGRQPLRQAQAVVEGLERLGASIRTRVGLVEPGDDGRPQPLEFEGHLRYTVCSHRASWRSGYEASRHRFYSTVEGLGGCSLHRSRINRARNIPGSHLRAFTQRPGPGLDQSECGAPATRLSDLGLGPIPGVPRARFERRTGATEVRVTR